jgi:hypothetical protein
MPRSDDAHLTSTMDLTAASAATAVAAPVMAPTPIPDVAPQGATCTCQDFRRNHVCDHVLMAAAVRMVRRMIDIHSDPHKSH